MVRRVPLESNGRPPIHSGCIRPSMLARHAARVRLSCINKCTITAHQRYIGRDDYELSDPAATFLASKSGSGADGDSGETAGERSRAAGRRGLARPRVVSPARMARQANLFSAVRGLAGRVGGGGFAVDGESPAAHARTTRPP